MSVKVVGKKGNKQFWGIRIYVGMGAGYQPLQEYVSFRNIDAAKRKALMSQALIREVEIREEYELPELGTKFNDPFVFTPVYRPGKDGNSPFNIRGLSLLVGGLSSTKGYVPHWEKAANHKCIFHTYPPRIAITLGKAEKDRQKFHHKSIPFRKSSGYSKAYDEAIVEMIKLRPQYKNKKQEMLDSKPKWGSIRHYIEGEFRHKFDEWPWQVN